MSAGLHLLCVPNAVLQSQGRELRAVGILLFALTPPRKKKRSLCYSDKREHFHFLGGS